MHQKYYLHQYHKLIIVVLYIDHIFENIYYEQYDLVFLDPPYAFDASEVMGLMKRLTQSGVVSPEAIMAYEHAIKSQSEVESAVAACGFDVHASKKYGKTKRTIVRMMLS